MTYGIKVFDQTGALVISTDGLLIEDSKQEVVYTSTASSYAWFPVELAMPAGKELIYWEYTWLSATGYESAYDFNVQQSTTTKLIIRAVSPYTAWGLVLLQLGMSVKFTFYYGVRN